MPKADVADVARVRAVLVRIHRARRFIGVQFAGESQVHQSIILGVEEDDFVIDEQFAGERTESAPPGSACTVLAEDRGISVSFATRVVEPSGARAARDYRLALPATITREERRDAFRVGLGGRAGYVVRIQAPNGNALCEATIRDLSATGLSLEVGKSRSAEFAVGTRLPECRLHIGDIAPFECDLEVRRVDKPDASRTTARIGVEFINLPADRRRALERVLMGEERDRRRRGARTN